MRILAKNSSACRQYAAEELQKYIRKISNCDLLPEIEYVEELPTEIPEDAIVLGLLSELTLDESDLFDPFMEDILDVRVENARGIIAGSNERSILAAVYQYCKSAGCRFLRPGTDGEYIPYCDLTSHKCHYRKKADHPFRGECCEGAISYEHMRDTVYWMPKVGMNMYMIEGLVPYSYMNRWYAHKANRALTGKDIEYDALEPLIDQLEEDIVKTGIQLHTIGHGWMFENLGIHHELYAREQEIFDALPEEKKNYIAMVNGKRDIFAKSTFFTHFCYSNPDARKSLVDFCVDYVTKKPWVDYLHVWLADYINNNCECENCVKMHPSDWYVTLLNEIDAALEAINAKTRLVFIMYNDTVRPPEKCKLNNPERFVLLAAIGQHYETGYLNEAYTGEIPPYVRNQNVTPQNALRLHWHREWKKLCGGVPSIIFEYRFYTDQYCDPGHMRIARETHRDMKGLENVSFQGCMSDQTHRMYLPTSLPMLLMGETLFDKNLDFEAYVCDYFTAAFGEDGARVREYLEKVSQYFCPANLRGSAKNAVEDTGINSRENKAPIHNNPYVAEQLAKLPALLEEFAPVIRHGMSDTDPARRQSFVYLHYHAEICRHLAKIYHLAALGQLEEAQAALDPLERYLSGIEPQVHEAFDLFLFDRFVRGTLRLKSIK
ncbi:MAG: DUF4838 domain-containing protein [Ruminococcaceae bacterium]|nr:DUF4838 domain-containing protein [Oscillospiraceae bacterium]